MKEFFEFRESVVRTADKKPEKFTKPDGTVGVRMIPTDRQIVKNEQSDLDEISLKDLTKAVSQSTGTKNINKAMNKDKVKKDIEAMKARLATEAKDPEEYDQEGDMAKSQLKTMIDAAQELHDMMGDDDNLPEWVQSKITKATDYIDSVRDYMKTEMSEKTLTPAEKKKREEIAKAMERENPGMDMSKKMAIATATAKRVAEEVELDEGIEKMSHSRLKWHMNTGMPHGSYSKDEMKAERDRRMQHRDSADAYKKAKPSMSEEAKPDAVEVMRRKQQMASISTSDKDKLAKIRAMLNKEKKK